MDLAVVVLDTEAYVEELASLEDWIRHEELPGVGLVRVPTKPGLEQMGASEALGILIHAAPALLQILRSVHGWLRSQPKKLTVEISNGPRSVKLSTENYSVADLDRIVRLLSGAND